MKEICELTSGLISPSRKLKLFRTLLRYFFGVVLLQMFYYPAFAQQRYKIQGRVLGASTGDPIPFANVYLNNASTGTTTNFQGYYLIETNKLTDSLIVSYIGYVSISIPVEISASQTINFQLEEDLVNLKEVVFYGGENPAYEVMRNVIKNKKQNDKRQLEAYEYESYTKIEIDIDNLSERFKKENNIMRQVAQVLDTIELIVGEDGKTILPIFISEAISQFYYKRSPRLRYENVIKTKLSGIGITDGTLTSQVVGTILQEYNFYQNWMNILSKEFASPLADGWKSIYEYELVDSLYLGDHYCYRLDIFPKRQQDLAFRGKIWIDKSTYALKQVDVLVDKSTNLNWIEQIKIQQELEPTSSGPWIPSKTRVLLNIDELSDEMAGLLAKFYSSAKDVVVNEPHEDSFYRYPVVMDEDINMYPEGYWEENRHDTLTATEILVFQMIDTLKNIRTVKRMTDLGKLVATGYHDVGKVDLGPYFAAFAANDVEGLRLGFGMRTNLDFSDKWILKGTTGYGFKDEEWKYTVGLEYIINRKPWAKIGIETRKDIDRLFLLTNDLDYSHLFYSYSRFGELRNPFRSFSNRLYFQTQIGTGLTQKVFMKMGYYEPLFDFEYYEDPYAVDLVLKSTMRTTEIGLETRFAKDELFIINDNNRISIGPSRWPSITFRYTLGLKDVLDGDFDYHKLELKFIKYQKMGVFGTSRIQLTGGYIIGQLPYPLLKNHVGNESPFYVSFAYNLMDFSEFSSDQYASFNYQHSFQGFILNRIPILKN